MRSSTRTCLSEDGCRFVTRQENQALRFERRLIAVSYTHLDVYKRQHKRHIIDPDPYGQVRGTPDDADSNIGQQCQIF